MAHKDKRFNPAVADEARQLWGAFLRERRLALGLSVVELADMMGCHRQRVFEMEQGQTNYSINQFLAALGCLRIYIQMELRDPDNDVPGLGPVSRN